MNFRPRVAVEVVDAGEAAMGGGKAGVGAKRSM